jgi:hypothetical protein
MTRLTRLCRALGVGLAVTTATLGMTQAADAAPKAPPAAPTSLAPPPGNEPFLISHAEGVQIYTCDGVKWGPSTPRADLVDDTGKLIVKHSGGPRWTAVADSSTVTAGPVARDPDGVLPADLKDIQQLLLKVPTDGATGGGLLGATTFIQRLNTKHGTQPPTAECKAQTAGKVKEVRYTADYVFFRATAKPA